MAPHRQRQHKAGCQHDLKHAHSLVTEPPRVQGPQSERHQDWADGDADAPTGVQPLHQPFTKIRRHVGVQSRVDCASTQSGKYAQRDHHPPLRRKRIADQRRTCQEAARRQNASHAHA